MKEKVFIRDMGPIAYAEAWDLQQVLLKELVDRKLINRKLEVGDEAYEKPFHYFLYCDHPPVYTLGKSGSTDHLLLDEETLKAKGIQFFKINRGGDITYHGPGQVVGYPIFDLDCFFTDVHKYVRYLEEAVILTLAEYGLEGVRIEGFTGVWLLPERELPKRKICAIGVHLSRWVTMHGFAFNINTDLDFFRYIIPCGIDDPDKTVTSLAAELGREIPVSEVKSKLIQHFARLFNFEPIVEKDPYEKGYSRSKSSGPGNSHRTG